MDVAVMSPLTSADLERHFYEVGRRFTKFGRQGMLSLEEYLSEAGAGDESLMACVMRGYIFQMAEDIRAGEDKW
jgi:hypothetical protein